MKTPHRLPTFSAAMVAALLVAEVNLAVAVTVTFENRDVFEMQLGDKVVDNYSHTGYLSETVLAGGQIHVHTNAQMSEVLGETEYYTTNHAEWNFVSRSPDYDSGSNPLYCSGCNGSFQLSFQTTSVGDHNGVFGVGFELPIANNVGQQPGDGRDPYIGFVTFGDNSTENFQMPRADSFFGLTSDLLVKSIHFGDVDGQSTDRWGFSIDNLTIGSKGSTVTGDFDGNGGLDGHDVDVLVAKIVARSHDSVFDLTGDGNVDSADLSQWLVEAASANGFSAPFRPGDANLDGHVNALDLNALGRHWLAQANGWQMGDFTADGSVNANDINEIGQNWLSSVPVAAARQSVPEPGGRLMLLSAAAMIACRLKQRRP